MTQNDAAQGEAHSPSDAELVRDFLSGREAAFEEIVRRYRKMAYYTALRTVGNHDDADDVVQSSFISAYRNLAGFRGQSSLKTWLYRIVMNYSKNNLRDRRRHTGEEIEEWTASVPPAVEAEMEQADRKAILKDAIARLPPRQQEVLRLRVEHDLSFAEISETIGITLTAAKVNYHHAVKALRAGIDPSGAAVGMEG